MRAAPRRLPRCLPTCSAWVPRFELAIPAEIGTVLRTLATMEGTLTLVDPGFDLVAEARQYAAAHVTGQLSRKPCKKRPLTS